MSQDPSDRPWEAPAWKARLEALRQRLGIGEEQRSLLQQALTHRGLSESAPHGDNERLEFLGDSVLALLVIEHLYLTYPGEPEGRLTKLKALYVSEPSLAEAATALSLGSYLALAGSDDAAGVRSRPSTLCDLFESILGALYLARGLDAAREFVREALIARVDPSQVWDHKSQLQEICQERWRITPLYRTDTESGPAHDRVFASVALLGQTVLGKGCGRSKKAAEQAAAANALERKPEWLKLEPLAS